MQCEYSQQYLLLQHCGLLGELYFKVHNDSKRNCTVCTVAVIEFGRSGVKRFKISLFL